MTTAYLILMITLGQAGYSIELLSFGDQRVCMARYEELQMVQHVMLTQCLPATAKVTKVGK